MIARPRGKPIHYLRNVERWIWVLIGGGALLFFAIVGTLALLYPDTPANQLALVALPALRQYAARRLSGTRIAW